MGSYYEQDRLEREEQRRRELIDVELSFQTLYLAAYDRAAELKESIAVKIDSELTKLLESCADVDPESVDKHVEHVRAVLTELADNAMAIARDNLDIVERRIERLRGF